MTQVHVVHPQSPLDSVAVGEAIPDATLTNDHKESSTHIEQVPTNTATLNTVDTAHSKKNADVGRRRAVANALIKIGSYVGTAAPSRFDDSEFKRGKAQDFPEIPGEQMRNSALNQIRNQYNQSRDLDGNITPSRPASIAGSARGSDDVDRISVSPRAVSPQRPPPLHTTSSAASNPVVQRRRRDTLEVPSPGRHSISRNNPSTTSNGPVVAVNAGQASPTIVVSSDDGMSSPLHRSFFDIPPPEPDEQDKT